MEKDTIASPDSPKGELKIRHEPNGYKKLFSKFILKTEKELNFYKLFSARELKLRKL
ncbi:MAG: hypothetical protein JHC93_03500, partial [Parachlamydiales bacterium]|nr:hypothetical protein [Parachlamydiales bacterium]